MLTPILLIAALAFVQISQSGTLPVFEQELWPLISAAMLLLLITEACSKYCARQAAAGQQRLPIGILDSLSQCANLGIFAYWALGSSWVADSRWTILSLAPLLILQLLLWLSIARCISGSSLKQRWGFVSMRLRFELIPILVLVFGLDLLSNLSFYLAIDDGTPLLAELSAFLCALALLSLLPLLLVRIWSCRKITGPLQQLIQEACQRCQTPVSRIYLWPRRAFPFYNAMAMGLFRRVRTIIISEDLVEQLQPDEIQAVIGHELGHLRHRHLLLYLLLLLCLSIVAGFIVSSAEPLYRPLVDPSYNTGAGLLLHVGLILLGIRFIFGLVSRACERQADLHGAQIAGFPAMQNALRTVALLTGQPLDTPNWRHHSIAERIDFLEQHAQNPHIHRQQHQYIMRISTLIIIALLSILMLSIWQGNQSITLEQLRKNDPQLNIAVDTALNQQSDELLYTWLADKNDFERQFYANAALARLINPVPRKKGEKELSEAELEEEKEKLNTAELNQLAYNMRFILTPFLRISSGNDAKDIEIDNARAYTLSVGAQSPEEQLAIQTTLKEILPRLEAWVAKHNIPEYKDTIGCVAFVLGDHKKALEYFTSAEERIREIDVSNDKDKQKQKERFLEQLKQRIQAATDKASDDSIALPQ